MIKLHLGKSLEQRTAKCSFCGESNKECVKGTVPFCADVYETDSKKVIEDYKLKFRLFGETLKVIEGYEYRQVVIRRENKHLDDADICYDCVKQLATLMKPPK